MSNQDRAKRATFGDAVGALFGAATGGAMLLERGVGSGAKALDIVDNVLDTGIKKSDNFRKRSALADDAEYMLDIVALIQSNPEVGEMYMADPSLLPEGITIDVLMGMLDALGEVDKPKVVKPRVVASHVSGRSRRTNSGTHHDDEY